MNGAPVAELRRRARPPAPRTAAREHEGDGEAPDGQRQSPRAGAERGEELRATVGLELLGRERRERHAHVRAEERASVYVDADAARPPG